MGECNYSTLALLMPVLSRQFFPLQTSASLLLWLRSQDNNDLQQVTSFGRYISIHAARGCKSLTPGQFIGISIMSRERRAHSISRKLRHAYVTAELVAFWQISLASALVFSLTMTHFCDVTTRLFWIESRIGRR